MTKEMILAILIGLAVGLLLTYGFYRARVLVAGPINNQVTTTATPLPSPTTSGTLILISPEDELVLTERKVTVAGTTLPNAQVVVFINNEDSLTTSDNSGNFSTERELAFGSNILTVHSVDQNGTATSLERTVIVADPEALTTEAATPAAQPR